MHSPRVSTFLGRTAAHAWRRARRNPGTVEGGHPCLGPIPPFCPKHTQWGFMPGLRAGHILLCRKSSRATCCVRRDIVLDIHKVSFKNVRGPGKHTIAEMPDVALVVGASIQHH